MLSLKEAMRRGPRRRAVRIECAANCALRRLAFHNVSGWTIAPNAMRQMQRRLFMSNALHLEHLSKGVEFWNEYARQQRMLHAAHPTRHCGAKVGVVGFRADLKDADLGGRDLYQGKAGAGWTGIELIGADLRGAILHRTNLAWANLTGATLADADLTGATLMNTRLEGANLSGANLSDATLGGANLLGTNLTEAKLTNAYLYSTNFSDTNLSGAQGLETCRYAGPCTVDYRTLFEYDPLPDYFLRGCGLPDNLIEYIPSLRGRAIHFNSCFISYSTKDETFVKRLYGDLQDKGVRCWFAPHDLPVGAKSWDAIDKEIRLTNKVLLILSQGAIDSDWVEDEVSKAFAEERDRGTTVLLPIRIDDAVMTTTEPWARKLRDQRNIGDFLRWNDPSEYQKRLENLVRALKA